ncbi:hypothetical protein [Streptomyces sp. YGL11-2]
MDISDGDQPDAGRRFGSRSMCLTASRRASSETWVETFMVTAICE